MKSVFVIISLVCFVLATASQGEAAMKMTSPAFHDNDRIPSRFTCQGEDISPPLEITGIPETAQTLALIVDDPDAPMGTWVHWVVFNIPADTATIVENSVPGIQAGNDFGRQDYGGPCPPSGTHRYFFKLYALDTTLQAEKIQSKSALEEAMQGHILEQAQLIGLYKKE